MVLLAAAVVVVGGCRPAPGDLLQLGESLAPFERMPYVQAVDTSSAWVLWRARPEASDSFVYRTESDSVWRSAAVERVPLDAEGPVLDSAMVDRRVHLTGLPTGARVQYTVVADSLEVGPITFRTAPAPGEGGTRVLAFGDSGWGSRGQILLAEVMTDRDWDLAIHMGDIAYQQGTEIDFTRRHFDVYRELLSSVPFFPSVGDHDVRTAGGAPYDGAFVWPAPEEGARYYTFRWGHIQFISLDTSGSTPAGRRLRRGERGPQVEWLRETLESLQEDPSLRWTIVFTHTPPYSHATGFGGHGSSLPVRRALAPLFDRYGVDLVLAGHDHHYERMWPIRDGERVRRGCGTVYVVSGGGGASRYARAIAPSRLSARSVRAYQFLELEVSEGGIQGTAVGTEGQTLDRFQVEPWAGEESGVPRSCR